MDLTTEIPAGVGILTLLWTIGLHLAQRRAERKGARRLREAHQKLHSILQSAQKPKTQSTLQFLATELELLKKEYPEPREIADAAASLSRELKKPELEAALSRIRREMLNAQIRQQLDPLVAKLADLEKEYGKIPEVQRLQEQLASAIREHEIRTSLHTGLGGFAASVPTLVEMLFDSDASSEVRAGAGFLLVIVLVMMGLFLSIFLHC